MFETSSTIRLILAIATTYFVNGQPFECGIRSGVEMLIKIDVTNLSYEQLSNITLQTQELVSGKIANHQRCMLATTPGLWCKTWSIFNRAAMTKAYRFRAIDKTTKQVLWDSETWYVPRHQIFHCYTSHDIKQLTTIEKDGQTTLQWKINDYDNKFSPMHIITIDGRKNNQKIMQKDCDTRVCSLALNGLNNCKRQKICVKTKFDVLDGKRPYRQRHMVKTCIHKEPSERCLKTNNFREDVLVPSWQA